LESEFARCEEFGKKVLPSLLEKCTASGKLALPEYMGNSGFTKKRVLKRLLLPCAETGTLGLESELGEDAVTGSKVYSLLLAPCEISGRKALARNLVVSELSSRKALPVHSRSCIACGKTHLEDESRSCASCQVAQCKKCCHHTECELCRHILSGVSPAAPVASAPQELVAHWPKASKWRYKKAGRLIAGVGVPGVLSFFTPKRLIMLEQNGDGNVQVRADRPL
jgi:hypothetical protein